MKPYYEQDGITIYHGDCREVLPLLADNSVDLIVTDPPYGVRWQSGARSLAFDLITGDESTDAAVGGIAGALPKLRVGRHVYAFGRYDLSMLPLTSSVELIWDKGRIGLGDLTLPWGPQHEPLMFAVYLPSPKHRERGSGVLSARMRRGSVLRVDRPKAMTDDSHPSQKPVMLLRQLIESSSSIGEFVMDPFMGVGSTLVASLIEGRRAIGIEIEEKYCEIAAKRLQQGVFPMEFTA